MAPLQRSLFIPDILPCPGPGLCDFHENIFGANNTKELSKIWFCDKCQKQHATTIYPPPLSKESSLSHLEILPTELVQHVADYLGPYQVAILALCSRTMRAKIGKRAFYLPNRSGGSLQSFLWDLNRDMPAYAPCSRCETLRHFSSTFAWPLLKVHRKERGINPSIHGVSQFLASKIINYYWVGPGSDACLSLLACKGTYRKPWAPNESETMANAGFSQDVLELGLPIEYEAAGRYPKKGPKTEASIITHTQYRIVLPQPWVSFSIAQRCAILRDFYLCPHTYASKVQYRDSRDPTYPEDSSIAHWLPHQGPIPEGEYSCPQCPSDFQSNFTSDADNNGKIVIDVWKTTAMGCNDGLKEMAVCEPYRYAGKFGRRSRLAFETAQGS